MVRLECEPGFGGLQILGSSPSPALCQQDPMSPGGQVPTRACSVERLGMLPMRADLPTRPSFPLNLPQKRHIVLGVDRVAEDVAL